MFKNYVTIAFRNLLKYKGYSAINILGLTMGLVCAIFVLLMIKREVSVNHNFSKSDRLYRVSSLWKEKDRGQRLTTLAPIGPLLKDHFPEVVNSNRSWPGMVIVKVKDKSFRESMNITEPSFFEMFDFPFLAGEPETALSTPNSVVVTEGLAQKFFGSINILGEVITFQTWTGGLVKDYKITGVLQKLPKNSVTYFGDEMEGMIISDKNLEDYWDRSAFESWYSRFILTFVELTENSDVNYLETQLSKILDQNCPADLRSDIEIALEPIRKIHLTDFNEAVIKNIKAMLFFAVLIVLVACVNYINLSTARFMQRAKEIGLRKVLGSGRQQLVKLFLSEAIILSLFALILGIGIIEFYLKFSGNPTVKDLVFDYRSNMVTGLILIGFSVLIGIAAGSYPAFFLASFSPVPAMRGGLKSGKSHVLVRKVLIIFQLALAVTFFVSANVITRQLNFMMDLNLGFDKDNVLIINSVDREFNLKGLRKQSVVKNALLGLPDVSAVSLVWNLPLGRVSGGIELSNPASKGNPKITSPTLTVDGSFLEVFDLQLSEGRFFSRDFFQADTSNSIIINEAAAQALQLINPVGANLMLDDGSHLTVVGVLKDFKIEPLNRGSDIPLSFFYVFGNPLYRHLALKVASENMAKTLSEIKAVWDQVNPDVPFEYEFMDQKIQTSYNSLKDIQGKTNYATGLAGFVACLGLLGLTSFAAERRTKEIGIRKVVGATVMSIVHLLTKEFVKLLVVAIILACPIAYFIMSQWLNHFPYQVSVGFSPFIYAVIVAISTTLFTISYQAIKSARLNPVDSLKYE